MARLLAIDPGNCTGFAVFDSTVLTYCGVTTVDQNPELVYSLGMNDEIVIELPQVYRAAQSKGDPNDLIKVALQVGRWMERAIVRRVPVHLVKPNEWKGQVRKEIHHERVRKLLHSPELDFVNSTRLPETKAHNMLDAVGLGLWRLGRMRRTA